MKLASLQIHNLWRCLSRLTEFLKLPEHLSSLHTFITEINTQVLFYLYWIKHTSVFQIIQWRISNTIRFADMTLTNKFSQTKRICVYILRFLFYNSTLYTGDWPLSRTSVNKMYCPEHWTVRVINSLNLETTDSYRC